MRATSIGHQRRADVPCPFHRDQKRPTQLARVTSNQRSGRGIDGLRPLTPALAYFSFLVRPTDLTQKVKRQAPRRRVVSDEAVSSAFGLRAAPTSSPIL